MEQNEGRTCANCGYFRQHYIWRGGYRCIDYGHCTHPPRVRHCRPGEATCLNWLPQEDVYRAKYAP